MATPLIKRSAVDLEVAEDILSTRINEQLTMLCDAQGAPQHNAERIAQINAMANELFAARHGLGALDSDGVRQVIAFYGTVRNLPVH